MHPIGLHEERRVDSNLDFAGSIARHVAYDLGRSLTNRKRREVDAN
jgi:hypothetical protein